jgi:hypothetical protein
VHTLAFFVRVGSAVLCLPADTLEREKVTIEEELSKNVFDGS